MSITNSLNSNQNMQTKAFIDGSRLIVESLVRSGADLFIGYPITPSNLLYFYSSRRFPRMLAAPDEITTLQWMCGAASVGLLPVTATSFPGFALMIESINMAVMMELPMVIILTQRLGPATGTATSGACGDVLLLKGMISGGFAVPVLAISNFLDCWILAHEALKIAINLRTPVVLLTSKEMVMTLQDFDISRLPDLPKLRMNIYQKDEPYVPYEPNSTGVPEFLPLGNSKHQVRITASTHNKKGIIQSNTPDSLQNSKRLHYKIINNLPSFTFYELDEQTDARTLIVSYEVTSQAAREAVSLLRAQNKSVSLLIVKTLLPIPDIILQTISKYDKVIIAEENLTGQYTECLFGANVPPKISKVLAFGQMISPSMIVKEVMA